MLLYLRKCKVMANNETLLDTLYPYSVRATGQYSLEDRHEGGQI